jgi:hypothetical protein
MGKHGPTPPPPEHDAYPTPSWVTEALLEHLDVTGMTVWEPATGAGQMANVLKGGGAARVYCSDIHDYNYQLDAKMDFLAEHPLQLPRFDAIITNPPYGDRCGFISPFITTGLRCLGDAGLLALLLPVDCDSAVRRRPYFRDCPDFDSKITLNKRITWFDRTDGKRGEPKEWHAWFVWRRPRPARAPAILYAPTIVKVPARTRMKKIAA